MFLRQGQYGTQSYENLPSKTVQKCLMSTTGTKHQTSRPSLPRETLSRCPSEACRTFGFLVPKRLWRFNINRSTGHDDLYWAGGVWFFVRRYRTLWWRRLETCAVPLGLDAFSRMHLLRRDLMFSSKKTSSLLTLLTKPQACTAVLPSPNTKAVTGRDHSVIFANVPMTF